jgi:tetratricopeptide (TPR) repeat protein
MALRYMEAREYETALPILERLNRQDPSNYPVFDRLITCLTELKRYPDAIARLEQRLDRRYRDIVTAVKLGETHHIAADTAKARAVWQRTLEANAQDLNAFRYVAETMTNRREYLLANEVYARARTKFGSADLFVMEVAVNWINAGRPGEGVSELIRFAEQNPQNSNVILRQILRFQDPELNDLAILELQERGLTQRAHHELMIGLLMEQGYYRRAYAAARQFEPVAPDGQFPLFLLASRLRAQNQFDLAADAYGYYVTLPRHALRPDAMVELARTRVTEADVLEFDNLDSPQRIQTIVRQADSILVMFTTDYGTHPKLTEAWLLHADLRLDHAKDPSLVVDYIARLSKTPSNTDQMSAADYLQGRIHLLKGEFAQARVSFTRSNRAVRTGDRAELTRYFLALTDFYAGDFEFARLQMKALERMSTSIYANDAIQLRRWLTEGTSADTSGAGLRRFAGAMHLISQGDTTAALSAFTELMDAPDSGGLQSESLTHVVNVLRRTRPNDALSWIDTWLPKLQGNPNEEEHLWLKSRILDAQGRTTDAVAVYIQTLERYPVGFYADRIRNRLRELNPAS